MDVRGQDHVFFCGNRDRSFDLWGSSGISGGVSGSGGVGGSVGGGLGNKKGWMEQASFKKTKNNMRRVGFTEEVTKLQPSREVKYSSREVTHSKVQAFDKSPLKTLITQQLSKKTIAKKQRAWSNISPESQSSPLRESQPTQSTHPTPPTSFPHFVGCESTNEEIMCQPHPCYHEGRHALASDSPEDSADDDVIPKHPESTESENIENALFQKITSLKYSPTDSTGASSASSMNPSSTTMMNPSSPLSQEGSTDRRVEPVFVRVFLEKSPKKNHSNPEECDKNPETTPHPQYSP